MEEIIRELEDLLGKENVLLDEPMSRHTTFRAGGPADLLLTPAEGQLGETLRILQGRHIPVTVIGNGSNLLVGDGGIRGAVIEIGGQMQEISGSGRRITAGAGALLSGVARAACARGLAGMEFAAGIPGSVGGALVMNAGAYGGEMKDIVEKAQVLTREGEMRMLSREELDLGYRRSAIPEQGYLVLEATFFLPYGEKEEISRRMEELRERRSSRQPLEYPSAGSTFKRPEGHFAGKLIMEAGLAGYALGGAQVSEKHCGFVINRDQATAADILGVIRHVQRTVKERFGVELEPEVRLIGEF